MRIHHRLVNHVKLILLDGGEDLFTRICAGDDQVVAEPAGQRAAHQAKEQGKLHLFQHPAIGIQIDLQR
ncbi:hypothetical protein D3C79_1038270 [compost metagenome]